MSTRPPAWITHPACLKHQMQAGHPECPQRIQAIEDRLVTSLGYFLERHEAPRATREALLRVHTPAHVDFVLQAVPGDALLHVDPDTWMNAHTAEAALRAAGAGVMAVDLVLQDRTELAFCAVRPPGHHAERGAAMGFCFLNNVAVAAAHALASGLERVAILDFDLHYGNGTADIFGHDPRVRLCSTYQHPLYPYWKGDPSATSLVDAALPPLAGSREFREAVANRWLPELEHFRPELILVSAGFDAHAQDGLGDLRLSYDDFRWIGSVISQLAEACCRGRVVATLEGGYNLTALARSVESFLRAFLGEELPV
ncbi:MAG: histone deacetylase family protein [Nevskia sp.]|nr:histone deacetylase family protein [Nevskia sp.]